MDSHASFAPSSASRWLNCPASAILSASLPNPESEASAEGTRVHKLIEGAIGGAPIPSHENEAVAYGIELVLDFVAKLGGKVLVEDEQSGFKVSPHLEPEGSNGQVLSLMVPSGLNYRNIRITALTPGCVFYGLQTREKQPYLPQVSFDHSTLPPA